MNCCEVKQFIKKRVEIEWDMLYQEDIVTRTVHDKKGQQDFVRRVVTGCEASLCSGLAGCCKSAGCQYVLSRVIICLIYNEHKERL